MKLIFDNEPFETPMLEKIADFYNKSEDKITIYLNSPGGRVSILKAVLHMVNTEPERFFLVGFHSLSSSAFEFYMKAKCKKEILESTIGMYHLGTTSIEYNDKMKTVYAFDDAIIDRKIKYHYPETQEFMKNCGFSPKEIKSVNNGQDIYFQFDRLKEIEKNYKLNTKK